MSERIKETATSFYELLQAACEDGVALSCRNECLRNVFLQAVDQAVEGCRVSFVGIFAKVDYCIRKYDIPHNVASLIHQTRREIFYEYNRRQSPGESISQEKLFAHHLRATCYAVYYLCGRVEVPASLRCRFPLEERKDKWGTFEENVLRVVVEKYDNKYIWATGEENGTILQISYGEENKVLTRNGKCNWDYMHGILQQGVQLNLVRVRREKEHEGILFPELIIFEPDYLVNVTSIAACFESYAESPLVHLINKIKPMPNTAAIHLGNLAGQLLDHTVHGRQSSFEEEMSEYVRYNALSMIACPELTDRERFNNFVEEARSQMYNIRQTIGKDFPAFLGEEYRKERVVLEPSFFSEILGIQGRMDFLYEHDGKAVIIEQKSGKGGYVSHHSPTYRPEVPAMREPHAVQALLYNALYQYEFSRYARNLHTMLYYSRYAFGLLSIPPMPELLVRAIRMRNLLAWQEIKMAEKGFDILLRLTPDSLNMKHISGKLWEQYVKPDLGRILNPLHEASHLERLYYLRMMRFVAREGMLSRLGTPLKENSGFAAIWHDTLEEKRQAGNICYKMKVKETEGRDSVSTVTLCMGDLQMMEQSNFRRGDIVILYPYNKDEVPNACAQMVTRASIVDISEEMVCLKLRNSQTDRRIFFRCKDVCWAMEHDFLDNSSIYSSIHSFLSAPQRRRDLLLFKSMPEVDENIEIKGDYGRFNELVRRVKQSRDLFLVIGPPGTGKTSYGLVNLLREELLQPGSNILLLSFTNRAVDEICDKLAALKKELNSLSFLRIGPESSCAPCHRENVLTVRCADARGGNEVKSLIQNTRVFCGTVSALQSNPSLLQMKHFTLAIVDEASQILEPHLMGILSAQREGRECIDKFVLIGDHKQLPAVVQQPPEDSLVEEPELRAIHLTDCRLSLFERLLSRFRLEDGGYDPRYVYMLTRQGRMHREVADFPNHAFYGGHLDIVPLQHQTLPTVGTRGKDGIINMLTAHRMVFVAAPQPALSSPAKTNEVEAGMIAATLYHIYIWMGDKFDVQNTVGVIVPYRNQISAVRTAIERYGVPLLSSISIDTVERFQGSQRDFIIYGFTVHRLYQLNFLTASVFEEEGTTIDRKLNVALTRARLHIVLIGNPQLLERVSLFKNLLMYIRSKGGYVEADRESYCSGEFNFIPQCRGTQECGLHTGVDEDRCFPPCH